MGLKYRNNAVLPLSTVALLAKRARARPPGVEGSSRQIGGVFHAGGVGMAETGPEQRTKAVHIGADIGSREGELRAVRARSARFWPRGR